MIIFFHTIFIIGGEKEAIEKDESVKRDLEYIINNSLNDIDKRIDLCEEFIDKW